MIYINALFALGLFLLTEKLNSNYSNNKNFLVCPNAKKIQNNFFVNAALLCAIFVYFQLLKNRKKETVICIAIIFVFYMLKSSESL